MAHRVHIVVPALQPNGGIREVIRLGAQLRELGCEVTLLCLWQARDAERTLADMGGAGLVVQALSAWSPSRHLAPLQWPVLWARFGRWQARAGHPDATVFTHYSTLALAGANPPHKRWFLVQDMEWEFLAPGVGRQLLRRWMLRAWRAGRLVSANRYLTDRLAAEGLQAALTLPVWASAAFSAHGTEGTRDVDVALVLRRGAHKRLDRYARFVQTMHRCRPGLRLAAVAPEEALFGELGAPVALRLTRPNTETLRALYGRARCFVHLSEHEGFGLPPLEAMGSGCVPVCTDSGGIRAYLQGDLQACIQPSESAVADATLALLDDPARWQALSTRCRAAFDQGLHATDEARARALRAWVGAQGA